ncbi:MAG: Adaptive-response sensory-kinase SasA [Bacteroidota bacterium]|jgi:C4-dicarboxylate-specific signal transduction histidine kinase
MPQNQSMQISKHKDLIRWILILCSFVIISLILWNTYEFFNFFKNEERVKMEYWAEAQKTLLNADENTEVELPFKVISNNKTIPIMLTSQSDSIISTSNIDELTTKDPQLAKDFLATLKKQNDPIAVEYSPGKYQYLYYGNSSLINKLKYYPIALLLIIVLFGALVYTFYKSTKMATQNKLWAGMAKETAHQIGTPLSSLIGWLELMKTVPLDASSVAEMEKDIIRLQTITDRFSKIGSKPVLETLDLVQETANSYAYLQARFSQQVAFSFDAPNEKIFVPLNAALHSWTIENLVKNAIDAMKGKGSLKVSIENEGKLVTIKVSDTGKGIPKNQFTQVFEPGFTTKKRGWGLGLSLTKRIVQDYHKGKIKVVESELGKGTTIQISYKIS